MRYGDCIKYDECKFNWKCFGAFSAPDCYTNQCKETKMLYEDCIRFSECGEDCQCLGKYASPNCYEQKTNARRKPMNPTTQHIVSFTKALASRDVVEMKAAHQTFVEKREQVQALVLSASVLLNEEEQQEFLSDIDLKPAGIANYEKIAATYAEEKCLLQKELDHTLNFLDGIAGRLRTSGTLSKADRVLIAVAIDKFVEEQK